VPEIKMLCMANSRKPGGRCIAGLLRGSTWIRPVPTPEGGAIGEAQTLLDIGRQIQPLDVVEVPTERIVARHHQQENQLIARRPWRFIEERNLNDHSISEFLSECAYDEDTLFGDADKDIFWREVKKNRINHSLALIRTSGPIFRRVGDRYGQPRFTSTFGYREYQYRLPITVVGFEECIPPIKVSEIYRSESDWWFTISLGEPFVPWHRTEKFCYKLIAGAIEIP